jgi:hypothetical protein
MGLRRVAVGVALAAMVIVGGGDREERSKRGHDRWRGREHRPERDGRRWHEQERRSAHRR